jgi:thiamine biosynthesis lipoprotein
MCSPHHNVPSWSAQIGPRKKWLAPVRPCLLPLFESEQGLSHDRGRDHRRIALWPLWRAGCLNLFCFCVALGGISIAQAGEEATQGELDRYVRHERHMGTEFAITAYGADAARIQTAFDAAFARIAELDRALSNYRSDSELSRVSHSSPHATMVPVSDDLWRVLRAADEVSRRSDGAFDVTVGPVSKLWRQARRLQHWPDQARWQEARDAVGFQHVQYDRPSRSVRLTRPGTRLDLGGIAKGYALDEAFKKLQQQGVTYVLVNGGGDVVAGQAPPGQPGWRVGVAGLGEDAEPGGDVEIERWLRLENVAVATSGDRWQFIELNGQRYSHLIDPRTGMAMTQRSSVTVIAPTGMQADAWASALSVLGLEAGWPVLERLEAVDAQMIQHRDDGLIRRESHGFARFDEVDALGRP